MLLVAVGAVRRCVPWWAGRTAGKGFTAPSVGNSVKVFFFFLKLLLLQCKVINIFFHISCKSGWINDKWTNVLKPVGHFDPCLNMFLLFSCLLAVQHNFPPSLCFSVVETLPAYQRGRGGPSRQTQKTWAQFGLVRNASLWKGLGSFSAAFVLALHLFFVKYTQLSRGNKIFFVLCAQVSLISKLMWVWYLLKW